MTNNDILRRVRYTFDFKDSTMVEIFALAQVTVTTEQVTAWLKKDDVDGFVALEDVELASFLNGLIILRRGARDGEQPMPEQRLNNNIILQKLRIAMAFKADDMLEVMRLADFNLSPHELSAFFRKPDNRQYRKCKDQILRYFLLGLQLHMRSAKNKTAQS
ncbi:hypothetical protein MAQ5080_02947 [Marinomonas aquimarina]|uniref:DUF1456 domain-containing protein n=1 Tax=Marinomonas aquimarina TaxID=295068 RepID=A0A1A8TNB7_9GAMM|nr:DUF1456 family protein [Marinomonas aquimarina]SBS34693.1 hypothetical protein MAQ5080_02947 [Marinomonas aquimarina]